MRRFLLTITFLLCIFAGHAQQNVGIGNTNPTEALDVTGNVKADTLKAKVIRMSTNAGAGRVLISDSAGNGSWQKTVAGKVYNGLTAANDTINFGGILYNNTNLNLAGNSLQIRDIGSSRADVATSTVATAATLALSATPITQTFQPVASCKLDTVYLNITALTGGVVNVQLLDENGVALTSTGKSFSALSNGLIAFPLSSYLSGLKNYTISVTGNANAFVNYDASNPYPTGVSSIGALADLGFVVSGLAEVNLLAANGNKVGIGTGSPTELLDVNGTAKAQKVIATNSLQLINNAAADRVLVSDASGNGSWTAANTVPGTISLSGTISGGIAGVLPVTANVFQFVGPSVNITLNGRQRVVMSCSVPLGVNPVNTGFSSTDLDIGFQNVSTTTITNAAGFNYSSYSISFPTAGRLPFSAHGTFKPVAGTYRIGPVIRTNVANYFNNNDFVSGFYMVINE